MIFTVVLLVIGCVAAVVGNWWTAAAMAFGIVGQVVAERSRRRSAAAGTTQAHG